MTGESGYGEAAATLGELCRQARELAGQVAGPLRRLRVRSGDTVLEIEWSGPPATDPDGGAAAPGGESTPEQPAVAAPEPAAVDAGRFSVLSPVVGTFYRAPEPGAAAFVEVGDVVQAGQVVGIVEAMKLMNQITAERGGTVVELLVADGAPVEYGQPLIALVHR